MGIDIWSYYNKKNHVKLTLTKQIRYWQKTLTEKCLNIFRWKGLPDYLPQKELEYLFTFIGYCGVTNKILPEDTYKLFVVGGSMSGVTNYPDEFTTYTFNTPKCSGTRVINDNIAVIDNTYSRLPTALLINRYALLLAHCDLSYQAILINARATGIIAAVDDRQAQSVNAWYNKLVNGDTIAIVDNVGMDTLLNTQGLRNVATQYPSSTSITDYFTASENLLRSFFNDIGLPMSREKKERVITDETKQDNARVLFNVNDMLTLRKEGCKKVNKMFGQKWDVELSEEYKVVEDEIIGNKFENEWSNQNSIDGTAD